MTAIAPTLPMPVPDLGRPSALTPNDLLGMEDQGLFEFVNGRVMEKRMAPESSWIAGRITHYLTVYLLQSGAGDVFPEQAFQCFPDDPDQIRRPDVAFVAAGRMPQPWPPGHLLVRPDLAIEVVSPMDTVYDVQLKLNDYRAADIPLVWIVYPHIRSVQQYAQGNEIIELRPGDTLCGDPVLPEFAVAVADLFPPAVARGPMVR